jgi:hypothetical protein
MHVFCSVYPKMQSNLHQSGMNEPNKYYNEIMMKYGTLYTKPKSDSKSDDSEEAANVNREEYKHNINDSEVQMY